MCIGLARRVLSDDLMMPAMPLMSRCCAGRDEAKSVRSVRLPVDLAGPHDAPAGP